MIGLYLSKISQMFFQFNLDFKVLFSQRKVGKAFVTIPIDYGKSKKTIS